MRNVILGRIALCAIIAALSACSDSDNSTQAAASTSSNTATGSSSTPTGTGQTVAPPTAANKPSVSTMKLSAASYSVAAGAGTAVLTVERNGTSGSTAIKYSTSDGSGKNGVDYTAASGTLTWSDGDTSIKKIFVHFASKASGKTFKVALAAASDNAAVSSPNVATVTVAAPATVVPPGAELAGYTTQTFGPSLKMGDNWYDMTMFWKGHGGTNNSDGTVTVEGTGAGAICSAAQDNSKPHRWKGKAFGGGAYFEAAFSFENADEGELGVRWPAFWAVDIENMAANAVTEQIQWQGQPTGYGNWIETDFMEYDRKNLREYGVQIHNWYGQHLKNVGHDVRLYKGAVKVPTGFKWSDVHKYGFLWVAATETTQGYAQAYLDDVPVGEKVVWNKYDPKLPPAPVVGTSAGSVIDVRHMALIIDTGPKNPMKIHSVSVWQASDKGNITQ